VSRGEQVRKHAPWDRSKGRPEPIRALNLVHEVENQDPLVRLSEFAPSVRVPRPTTIAFCRHLVALMAEQAAQSLPKGVVLVVTDAYRPLSRQQRIYDWFTQCVKDAFPHLNHAQTRRKVNRWVAPCDQKAPPGHCTGAALDVILEDEYGEPLDVASPYDRFLAGPTYTIGLSEVAQFNRDLLVNAMLNAGFSNCRDEWWHYSYGDAGWAVRLNKFECFYGLAELPVHEYEQAHKLWLRAFEDRVNPFFEALT